MKIYNRKHFMALPAGTFYHKGQEWIFEGLAVKDDNCGEIDFFTLELGWIETEDCGEAFHTLEKMKANHISAPMQTTCCRDGLFEKDAMFLVYEEADLIKLRNMIDVAIANDKKLWEPRFLTEWEREVWRKEQKTST